jgi:hypothetical protein
MKIIYTLKSMKYIALVLLCSTLVLSAQSLEEHIAETILRMNESLLEGYAQPLINCYSTGISSGLFHSAYSCDFFEFELGFNMMYIDIPGDAKFFDGSALLCSLALDTLSYYLEYYEVEIESLSTVFGPAVEIEVPTQGNAIGIPMTIPAGYDRSFAPLIMPQVNVGLFFGLEAALRYVPFRFQGSRMDFFGVGLKQEINSFPLFKNLPLPIALAVGGAYQQFDLETADRSVIAKSRTWNFQVLASKRIGPFEPMVGFGIENTYAKFNYVFEYEIPDTISGIPYEYINVQQNIAATMRNQHRYRKTIGCSLHMGSLFFHYDYNITPYTTHNATIGVRFR